MPIVDIPEKTELDIEFDGCVMVEQDSFRRAGVDMLLTRKEDSEECFGVFVKNRRKKSGEYIANRESFDDAIDLIMELLYMPRGEFKKYMKLLVAE